MFVFPPDMEYKFICTQDLALENDHDISPG